MLVKLTQDLSRGLAPWKEMFFENEAELNALGAKLIFAGTEKDDDNKLTVIIDFDSPEAMKAFGGIGDGVNDKGGTPDNFDQQGSFWGDGTTKEAVYD